MWGAGGEDGADASDHVGPLRSRTFAVDERRQADYLAALEDEHPRYRLRSGGRRAPLVHPAALLHASNATKSPSFDGPNLDWLHARERARFVRWAELDETLTAAWRIVRRTRWGGRPIVEVRCAILGGDGTPVLERTSWGTLSVKRGPGDAPAASPRRVSPGPASAGVGAGPGRHVTQWHIDRFSGQPGVGDIHTDPGVAVAAGLSAPVASAVHGAGYICAFLLETCGQDWLNGATLALWFRQPLLAGDSVRVSGSPALPRLVNQYGAIVTSGRAGAR